MTTSLSRREFLKLAGLFSAGAALPGYLRPSLLNNTANQQNVLIIVFDAWSARNISLYGYARRTMPNLERLAEKAIVYHNHSAGGHFTTPGTASLLTGTTPWTHRAFKHNDTVDPSRVQHNLFNAFPSYHRVSYTHNPLANTILEQFISDIDEHTPWQNLYLESDPLISEIFKNDQDVALVGWRRGMKRLAREGHSYTLYLSKIVQYLRLRQVAQIAPQFPRGIPRYTDLGLNFFTLEQGLDWTQQLVSVLPQPFLGYFHFLPPHDPYFTRHEFIDAFLNDGIEPREKPLHPLDQGVAKSRMIERHRWYDEFILYVDAEFARLHAQLEASGQLENTWIVLTADHGEMFERGILGHVPPVFHAPIMHIPLMIFPPGQSEHVDVYEHTSAIDLLPTLLQITGQEIPGWAEGLVLPPFAATIPQAGREIPTIQVEGYHPDGSIHQATAVLQQGDFKIMWYLGYPALGASGEYIELYNLAADPEEIRNLYPQEKDRADAMLTVLRAKLDALNTELTG